MHLTALSAVVAAALLPASALFPAKTPLDVVRLATAVAPGGAHYVFSSDSAHYSADIVFAGASKGGVLHVKLRGLELWADAVQGKARYTCEARTGAPARCYKGDPRHILAAAAAATEALSNEVIEKAFMPATKLSATRLSQTRQAGQRVSCLTLTTPAGTLRLCARNGFPTEITVGHIHVIATRVWTMPTAKDFAPPATPR